MFRTFYLQLHLNLTKDIKTEMVENSKYELEENLIRSNCKWIENSVKTFLVFNFWIKLGPLATIAKTSE